MANPAIGLEAIFDIGQFSKNMGKYTQLLGVGERTTKTSAGGIGAAMAGIGKVAAVGMAAGVAVIAAAGAAVVGLVAASIPAASNLSESINALNVVFGEGAAKLLEYGKTAAQTVGLSNAEFNKLATTTGAFLQNVGFNADQAGEETIKLTERAADMASVFNTDVATAMGAIQSGLKGEFNPLEQFGVKMNAAGIEAKALEMGLAGTAGELTDTHKAAAALALIYDQTAKVEGDFANTSDGLANSQRILAAQMEDLKAKIGMAVLPAVAKLTGAFSKIFADPRVQKFISDFASGLAEIAEKILPPLAEWLTVNIPLALQWLADTWMNVLQPAIKNVWKWMQTKLFPALAKLWEWLSINVPLALQWLADTWTNVLQPAIVRVWDWMQTSLFPALADLWAWLSVNIPLAIQTVSDYWNNTLLPAIQAVWAWIAQNLIPVLTQIYNWLAINIPLAIQTVSDYWTSVLLPAITAVGDFLTNTLFPIFSELWTWLSSTIIGAIDTISGYWSSVFLPAITAVWSWISENLLPLFNELVGLVGDLLLFAFESVSTFLTATFTPAVDAGSKIWKNNLLPAIKEVYEWFNSKILPVLKDVATFFNTVFNAAIENATRILREKFGAAVAWISEKLQALTNWIAELRSMLDNLSGDAQPPPDGGGDGGGSGGGGDSGDDGSCFLAGTLVSTPGGPRSIDELDLGDAVTVLTESGPEASPIIGVKRTRRRGVVVVELSDGNIISCSENHRFLLAGGGWCWAGYLQPRTLLVSETGEQTYVVTVLPIVGYHTVYNLTIDHPDHTFIVAGVVVHNIDAKASGGPVKKGRPYFVGEEGLELFAPGEDGAIIPNNRLRDIMDNIMAPALSSSSSAPTPSGAVTNVANTWNLGGQTINSPMDFAALQNAIRQTVRAELRGA